MSSVSAQFLLLLQQIQADLPDVPLNRLPSLLKIILARCQLLCCAAGQSEQCGGALGHRALIAKNMAFELPCGFDHAVPGAVACLCVGQAAAGRGLEQKLPEAWRFPHRPNARHILKQELAYRPQRIVIQAVPHKVEPVPVLRDGGGPQCDGMQPAGAACLFQQPEGKVCHAVVTECGQQVHCAEKTGVQVVVCLWRIVK